MGSKDLQQEEAAAPPKRRIGFECLEQRRLLSSVGLSTISNITLAAGTSTLVAFERHRPRPDGPFRRDHLRPNEGLAHRHAADQQSVQFNIDGLGTMTFQLFDNLTPNTASWIENLVNAGFYNGDYIYRAETGSFALIQGGNNPPQINSGANVNPFPASFGSTTTINEEFNPDLNYTTAGALAMARTGSPNTSSSEFFITDGATRRWITDIRSSVSKPAIRRSRSTASRPPFWRPSMRCPPHRKMASIT